MFSLFYYFFFVVFCNKCSSGAVPLEKYGMTKAVRVCDSCFATITAEMDPSIKVTAKSPRGQRTRHERTRSRSKGKKTVAQTLTDSK